MPNIQRLSLDKKAQIGTVTLNVVSQETINETAPISKTISTRLGFQIDENHFAIKVIVISAGECSCKEGSMERCTANCTSRRRIGRRTLPVKFAVVITLCIFVGERAI